MTQINEGTKKPLISSHQDTTITKRTYLITIIIGLILFSGIWIWKTMEISNLKKNAETEKQAMRMEAYEQLMQAHEQHLKLLAKPFVWAVRSEMMQGNMSQVNLYMNDMVKEKNIERIAIVNDKGTIVSSTNKKDEGKPFSTIGNSTDLEFDDTNLKTQKDTVISMTSPIMGFNKRLGTLFIKYSISGTELPE